MKFLRIVGSSVAIFIIIYGSILYTKSFKTYQSTLHFLQGNTPSALALLEQTNWQHDSATSYLHFLLAHQPTSLLAAARLNPHHYWYLDLVISQETVDQFPATIYSNRSPAFALFLADKALQQSRIDTPEAKYKGLFLATASKSLYPNADSYYTLAEILRTAYKSYDHAEKMYVQALRKNPTNLSYWRSYGYCSNSMKNYRETLSCYVIQERLDPGAVSPLINIAKTLYQMGYFEDAVQRLQNWIADYPDQIEFYFALGSIYNTNKEYDKAEFSYQKAIELFPQEPVAYYELGNYFYSQKEYRKALLQHTKAIGMTMTQKKSVSAWWWYRKGLDYYQLEDFEGAVKSFHEAMDISQSSSFTYWLGRSYEALEEYEKAIHYYDDYLMDHPTNTSVQTLRSNCLGKMTP
ncbi:MAG: tetratricopeptide repeat protein [Caldisericia bacterium]|nr:tetratricopeptide repeat protein [Caldisericia bacterium]MDD4614517.1 tetratricopeptide repeat protein [Caldisericia bacterium]